MLTGEGLQLLGSAAYWTGRPDETSRGPREGVRRLHGPGRSRRGGDDGLRVAEQHGMRLEMSQAGGWATKAAQLAEENPAWPVHGWLMWMRGLLSWFKADFEAAVGFYDQALDHAARSGDRDLHGMSLHDKGHALCLLGRVAEGTPPRRGNGGSRRGRTRSRRGWLRLLRHDRHLFQAGRLSAGSGMDRGHPALVRTQFGSSVSGVAGYTRPNC